MIVYENRASYILYNILVRTDLNKKIIVPVNVCPIVIATLMKAKKPFKLIDINTNDYCIDTNKVMSLLHNDKDQYDTILFVRTYGAVLNKEDFFAEIKEQNKDFLIIDDRCLAKPNISMILESNVDVVLYSSGYVKFVELGFGGFAHIKDSFKYERHPVQFIERDHEALTNHFREVIAGNESFIYEDNQWLDSSVPKVTFEKYLNDIDSRIYAIAEHKSKLNKIYKDIIPQEIVIGSKFNDWRFNILVEDKQRVIENIFKEDLFASSHYSPMSRFFSLTGYDVAEKVYSSVVNLFNDHRFTEDMAYRTAQIVKKSL